MKKLLVSSISITFCLLLTACSTTPYGTGKNQGSFLGTATVSSNTNNICTDTNGQYAFQGSQSWLAGGQGTSWYTCTAKRNLNFSPEYMVNYNIIKNDGTGKNVVARCMPVNKANNGHFTQLKLQVQLNKGVPSCQAILS